MPKVDLGLTTTFPFMSWSGKGKFTKQLPHSFNVGPGKWVTVLDTGLILLPGPCLIESYRMQGGEDFLVTTIRSDSIEKIHPGGKVVVNLANGILTVWWDEM